MPGKIPRGKVCDGLVRHIDIGPTVLDVLGIAREKAADFQGTSLYPIEGDVGSDFAYFECAAPFIMYGWSGLRGVRSDTWKYIEAPREELYDLGADPWEKTNLIDQAPQVADSLKGEMRRIITEMEIFDRSEGANRKKEDRGKVGEFEEKLRNGPKKSRQPK